MIKEIRQKVEKYKNMLKDGYEIIYINEVLYDFRELLKDARLKRIPKKDR